MGVVVEGAGSAGTVLALQADLKDMISTQTGETLPVRYAEVYEEPVTSLVTIHSLQMTASTAELQAIWYAAAGEDSAYIDLTSSGYNDFDLGMVGKLYLPVAGEGDALTTIGSIYIRKKFEDSYSSMGEDGVSATIVGDYLEILLADTDLGTFIEAIKLVGFLGANGTTWVVSGDCYYMPKLDDMSRFDMSEVDDDDWVYTAETTTDSLVVFTLQGNFGKYSKGRIKFAPGTVSSITAEANYVATVDEADPVVWGAVTGWGPWTPDEDGNVIIDFGDHIIMESDSTKEINQIRFTVTGSTALDPDPISMSSTMDFFSRDSNHQPLWHEQVYC